MLNLLIKVLTFVIYRCAFQNLYPATGYIVNVSLVNSFVILIHEAAIVTTCIQCTSWVYTSGSNAIHLSPNSRRDIYEPYTCFV